MSDAEIMQKLAAASRLEQWGMLSVSLNDHHAMYCTAEEAASGDCGDELAAIDKGEWLSEGDRKKALNTDTVWTVIIYPKTPIGCVVARGSSLESAGTAALMAVKETYENE